MALRLLEVYVPGVEGERVREILKDRPTLGMWHQQAGEETHVRILLRVEETEGVLDLLQQHFGKRKGFRVLLLTAEATLPREEELEEEVPREAARAGPGLRRLRVSREELYADISKASEVSAIYVLLIAMASVVAAVGILRNDLIILIGAMVIAPMFGPNAALALATTLGDFKLARQAVTANLLGILLAVITGAFVGFLIGIDPLNNPQIAGRTQVDEYDILLAVVAGSAGAVAFTIALPTALIGVMVAVALLPPSVTLGMLVGGGHLEMAMRTFLLLLVYVVGINLSGVVIFRVQGIHPLGWWEAERAKVAARTSVLLWLGLLALLATILLLIR